MRNSPSTKAMRNTAQLRNIGNYVREALPYVCVRELNVLWSMPDICMPLLGSPIRHQQYVHSVTITLPFATDITPSPSGHGTVLYCHRS